MRKQKRRKKRIGVILISVTAVLVITLSSIAIVHSQLFRAPIDTKAKTVSEKPQIIRMPDNIITAHRGGGNHAAENTVAGIEYAIENKASHAEIDVTLSKDKHVVLAHDADLGRVTGGACKNKIEDMTLAELQSHNVGSYLGAHEQIPTLEQIITRAKGRIRLNIEIKPGVHAKEAAQKVLELIKTHQVGDQVVVTSFSYSVLQEVRKINPAIKIGIISGEAFDKIKNMDVDFYSMHQSVVDAKTVTAAHQQNRRIFVWTVNDKKALEQFVKMQVDGIITDEPQVLRNILKAGEHS